MWYAAVLIAGLAAGIWAGQRLALARSRWGELKGLVADYQNQDSLQELFVSLMRARDQATKLQQHDRIVLINFAQFVVLWNWDLTVVLGLLARTKSGWERKLHARVLALTIYEAFKKFRFELLGPDGRKSWALRPALERLNVAEDVVRRFDVAHEDALNIWEGHSKLLSGIRHNAIGHRDLNVEKQVRWTRDANVEGLLALGVELLGWTTATVEAITALFSTRSDLG